MRVVVLRASDPHWLLDRGDLSVLHHIGLSNMAVCFIEAGKRKGNREPANKMKGTIFCNLITEMTSHHQILGAKTSHYIQPTLKERRIKKEMRTRRQGSLEVILEICLKK